MAYLYIEESFQMTPLSYAMIAHLPDGFVESQQYYQSANNISIVSTSRFGSDGGIYDNPYNCTCYIYQGTIRVINGSPSNIGASYGWIGVFLIWLTD